jgi:hypothetical protein
MPKLNATAGGVDIEDGSYDATLLSIELTAATPNSPNQGPWFKWTFHVYDTEEGVELTAGSSQRFGPKAKARLWVEALLGRKLDTGEEIDTDTLAPKDCQVVVKRDEKGFARICEVLPVRRRRPPTATTPRVTAMATPDGVIV